ncbi:acyltransferase [Scytonema millei VB511283]|uniref:Acyltransferase n=2 Tax=Scytonema TaxID=1203 RepID=A0A9X5I2L9_9CYAN|nr:acyltransferase [Scytonema millei VB511283]
MYGTIDKFLNSFFNHNFFKSKLKNWMQGWVDNYLSQKLSQGYWQAQIDSYLNQKLAQADLEKRIEQVQLNHYLVYGDPQRLKLSASCVVNNALFNLSSGTICIGEDVFFGHNVSLITGTHDYTKFGKARMYDFPTEGNDIAIEEGVWIASNVTVIGPCKIGKHSVVAAGAVVKGDVPSYQIVAGVPAKIVKTIVPTD